MTQASFTLQTHNPDVLSCIANLSNDEVFTSPELANLMLDHIESRWAEVFEGANIWQNPEVKFLDPFTKSGVFLREITRRLTDGLESAFPDRQERVNHILTRQVYGIAVTQLTAMLSRRSVYCSKHANGRHSIATSFKTEAGNIWYERTEHTWRGGRKKFGVDPLTGEETVFYTHRKCKYCGANEADYSRGDELETHAYAFIHTDNIRARVDELFGEDMQFDVIIGNPPYQLEDGGAGSSAQPIYHKFVESAIALDPRFLSLVIPARWYTGGKGLNEFRAAMLSDERISSIHDYPDTHDVFPGINVRGGIMHFLWERDYHGQAAITNYMGGRHLGTKTRPLLEPGLDSFIRFSPAVDILRKVVSIETGQAHNLALPSKNSFSQLVSSRKPFGLATNFKEDAAKRSNKYSIALSRFGKGGYVAEDQIKDNIEWVSKWKLFVPYASPGSDVYPHLVLSNPLIGGPGTACTETYLVIGPFTSEEECINVRSYMRTQFFRFMVLLLRASQHVTKRVYRFVPLQDFSMSWDDRKLYEKYQITSDESAVIDALVKPVRWDE